MPPSNSSKGPQNQATEMRPSGMGAVSAQSGIVEPELDLSSMLDPATDPGEIGWLAHYRVLKVLGKGGMGIVFQAEDTHLRRLVALKAMLPQLANHPIARERFLREARAIAALKNDHIVTIFQVGQERDMPFLAMEFLQGQSLADWLTRNPQPRLAEVIRIGREIALGLAAAHQQGLIHRDIKPANIWLERIADFRLQSAEVRPESNLQDDISNLQFRIKILDFGLACPTSSDANLTDPGTILGTPFFMAPEQARGEVVDERADLFSLGAILYLMSTGQLPFEGFTPLAVMTALTTQTPRAPRAINSDLPVSLADLIMHLLEKDPARRPASARAVADALAGIESQLRAFAETPFPGITGLQPAGLPSASAPSAVPAQTPTPAPPPPSSRRRLWLGAGGLILLAFLGLLAFPHFFGKAPGPRLPQGAPIKVGVLHSSTGTMAISERSVSEATLFAIEELNQQGGVLGRPVEAIIEDGESDDAAFAARAEKLIASDKVTTLFGCWTSSSRKAVKRVVEKHDHLLFYPVQYEGMEQSPNIVYLGSIPNQQILPALQWCFAFKHKKRWFLVGSDYLFPRAANAVIRDEAKNLGAQVLGEEYIIPGRSDVSAVVAKIVQAKPDLIVNTLNGDVNLGFFRELYDEGITAERSPMLSFSVTEVELGFLTTPKVVGQLAAWSYFQSIDTPANKDFLKRYAAVHGSDAPVSDPMQSAYCGVHLWAKAVEAAGSDDIRAIRKAVPGQKFDGPQGLVEIDPATQHLVQKVRVGQVNAARRFEDVYVSPAAVRPMPFPESRSRAAWESLLDELYRGWGGNWSNRGVKTGPKKE